MRFKSRENPFLIITSLLFFIPTFLLIQNGNYLLAGGFTGVAVFATLHHIVPDNAFLRFMDWCIAILCITCVLVLYRSSIGYLEIGIAIVSFLVWILSYTNFHLYKNIKKYTLLHSAWHILVLTLTVMIIVQ